MNKVHGMILLLVSALILSSCRESERADVCTVVLANPRSGSQASLGREIGRALDLVNDELKRDHAGSIVIREVDTAGNPTVAKAEVERAVQRWHAPVVVGSILSSDTREFLGGLIDRGVVVLANGSSDPAIRNLPYRRRKDGFFRNWPADDFEGKVMAEYLRSTNRARKLVVMHASDPYAASLAEAFRTRFISLGGEVLGPEVYPVDLTSFSDLVRRQPVEGHDGYYLVGFPVDLAGIYNTLRADTSLVRDKPIYSAVGIDTGEFTALVRYPLDNLFFTAPALDESSRAYFDFRESYRARFKGDAPDIVAAVTYDALRMAVEAISMAGCNSTGIREHLYNAPPFDGAAGPTGFDDMGDVITKATAIKYYEDGRQLQAELRSADKP